MFYRMSSVFLFAKRGRHFCSKFGEKRKNVQKTVELRRKINKTLWKWQKNHGMESFTV